MPLLPWALLPLLPLALLLAHILRCRRRYGHDRPGLAPPEALRVPFRRKDAAGPWDAVVIGSGVGGLVSAALLAKAGRKVLVLERHDRAGGCTHTFDAAGFEFDTGVHYVGGMGPGSRYRILMDEATEGRLDWAFLGDTYDRFYHPSAPAPVPMKAGLGPHRAALVAAFPAEAAAIDRYLAALEACGWAAVPYWWCKCVCFVPEAVLRALAPLALRLAAFHRFTDRSVSAALADMGCSPALARTLAYLWGDYGAHPDQAPFALHALCALHYIEQGAFFPVGGSSSIARALLPTITRNGGAVRVRCAVEQILVEGGKAVGVRTHRGVEVRAPLVVSASGAATTFHRLLPAEEQRRIGLPAPSLTPSMSCLFLFLGLSHPGPLPADNLWFSFPPLFDAHPHLHSLALSLPPSLLAALDCGFISFPSAKDPTYGDRLPGKSTCTLLAPSTYDYWRKWEGTRVGQRGNDYEVVKRNLETLFRAVVLHFFPDVEASIVYSDVATPLTSAYYINAPGGSIYGGVHDSYRFHDPWVRPQTPITNLYLTGQDVASCGVVGALMGAYITATRILNEPVILDVERVRRA